MITIDDFAKIELRTAKVIEAEDVEWSKKLIKLKVRIGKEEKTILAGIKEFYSPQELVGKIVVVVNNLQPKKVRDLVSEGMLLAVDGEKVVLVTPEKEVEDGLRVR